MALFTLDAQEEREHLFIVPPAIPLQLFHRDQDKLWNSQVQACSEIQGKDCNSFSLGAPNSWEGKFPWSNYSMIISFFPVREYFDCKIDAVTVKKAPGI